MNIDIKNICYHDDIFGWCSPNVDELPTSLSVVLQNEYDMKLAMRLNERFFFTLIRDLTANFPISADISIVVSDDYVSFTFEGVIWTEAVQLAIERQIDPWEIANVFVNGAVPFEAPLQEFPF